jgi:hypothetical protein
MENFGVDIGTARLKHACRAAGDDDALAPPQFRCGRIAGLYICIDAEFPNPAGDQMCVLPAGIEDGNLGSNGWL